MKRALNVIGKAVMLLLVIGFIGSIYEQKQRIDRVGGSLGRPGEILLLSKERLECPNGIPFADNAGLMRPIPTSEEVSNIGIYCYQSDKRVFVKYNDISEIQFLHPQ